jgi:hypothetical protein
MGLKTTIAPVSAITPVAGRRVYTDLVNAVQTHRLVFTLAADVVIGVGGGTAVRNRGSVLALFEELGLDENGQDKAVLTGRIARQFAEMFAPSALAATRLTTAAAGNYSIREQVALHFASPISANPAETTFREHNVKNALRAFVRLSAQTLIDRLISGAPGGSSVTITQCDVQQVYDSRTEARPYFIPTYRMETLAVPSANSDAKLEIKTSKFLRALVLAQDSDAGEVGDIIASLELRGDHRHIVGPGKVPWDDLTRLQEAEFGGTVYVTGTGLGQNGFLAMNFQRGGRLSNVINPSDDVNLRFLLNVAPSAQAGATNGIVRLALCELETDPNLTRAPEELAARIPV